jgi:hypothetical protein
VALDPRGPGLAAGRVPLPRGRSFFWRATPARPSGSRAFFTPKFGKKIGPLPIAELKLEAVEQVLAVSYEGGLCQYIPNTLAAVSDGGQRIKPPACCLCLSEWGQHNPISR